MSILFIYILVACLLLWKSSSAFETASNFLGRHMSEGVKGATINAIASSIPELLTTFFFLFFLHNEEGFSGGIGTTAGSAIFNGMIIPSGVIFMVVFSKRAKYITVSSKVFLRDGISLILAELLLIMLLSTNALHWYHGLILMLIYIAYASYTIISMKKAPLKAEAIKPKEIYKRLPIWKGLWIEDILLNKSRAWQLLTLSTLIMSAACLLLVYAIEQIGYQLDLPVMFLAVVVASAASSIPDALISLRDARQGQYDDAIANALGSNIFDISFALGLPLFLYTLIYKPIEMPPDILAHTAELRLLLLSLTVFSFLVFVSGKRMGWEKASLLSLLYIIFLVHILARSRAWEWSQPITDVLMYVWDFLSFLQI